MGLAKSRNYVLGKRKKRFFCLKLEFSVNNTLKAEKRRIIMEGYLVIFISVLWPNTSLLNAEKSGLNSNESIPYFFHEKFDNFFSFPSTKFRF